MRSDGLLGVLLLSLLVEAGCRREPTNHRSSPQFFSDAGAEAIVSPSQSAVRTTSAVLPACVEVLAPAPEPADFASFAAAGESGARVTLDRWTVDHYQGGTFEVPLGPFVVRYAEDGRGQSFETEIREARCAGPALRVHKGWPGGSLRLRHRGETWVVTYLPGGTDEVPLASFRRLRVGDAGG